ncbi:hypothetical protein ABPG75_006657 [Micractinium tetrahymenae]
MQLQNVMAAYLQLQGRLDARGLVEYVQEVLAPPRGPKGKTSRVAEWVELLEWHPELEACSLHPAGQPLLESQVHPGQGGAGVHPPVGSAARRQHAQEHGQHSAAGGGPAEPGADALSGVLG